MWQTRGGATRGDQNRIITRSLTAPLSNHDMNVISRRAKNPKDDCQTTKERSGTKGKDWMGPCQKQEGLSGQTVLCLSAFLFYGADWGRLCRLEREKLWPYILSICWHAQHKQVMNWTLALIGMCSFLPCVPVYMHQRKLDSGREDVLFSTRWQYVLSSAG